MIRPAPTAIPLPYTTLFRSVAEAVAEEQREVGGEEPVQPPGAQRAREEQHGEHEQRPVHAVVVPVVHGGERAPAGIDRKSTRLNSSHVSISYAVFCLKK